MINVAGTAGVQAPVTQNIITAELRGSELADAPLQRTGVLRGTSVSVDIRQQGVFNGFQWIGSPLFNASGYVGLIQRDVGQLTTAGGTVKLSAGGSVVLQSGSKIDVSGGYIDYQGGIVQTTRVLSGGILMDISQATPGPRLRWLLHRKIHPCRPEVRRHRDLHQSAPARWPPLRGGLRLRREWRHDHHHRAGHGARRHAARRTRSKARGSARSRPRSRTLSLNFQAQDASNVLFPVDLADAAEHHLQPELPQAPVAPFTVGEVALPASRLAQVSLSPALFDDRRLRQPANHRHRRRHHGPGRRRSEGAGARFHHARRGQHQRAGEDERARRQPAFQRLQSLARERRRAARERQWRANAARRSAARPLHARRGRAAQHRRPARRRSPRCARSGHAPARHHRRRHLHPRVLRGPAKRQHDRRLRRRGDRRARQADLRRRRQHRHRRGPGPELRLRARRQAESRRRTEGLLGRQSAARSPSRRRRFRSAARPRISPRCCSSRSSSTRAASARLR